MGSRPIPSARCVYRGAAIPSHRRATLAHLPSLAALESHDDDQLVAELRLARLRSQVAVVRAMVDQVEHVSRAKDAEGVRDQLIEEMTRLGCQLLKAAGSLAESRRPEESGIFARRR